jgi:hypothetical protein
MPCVFFFYGKVPLWFSTTSLEFFQVSEVLRIIQRRMSNICTVATSALSEQPLLW